MAFERLKTLNDGIKLKSVKDIRATIANWQKFGRDWANSWWCFLGEARYYTGKRDGDYDKRIQRLRQGPFSFNITALEDF